MIKKAPIRFLPYLKPVIWGGEKICQYKDLPASDMKIGESWEISAIPGHESIVAEGEYKGLNIIDLIERFGSELLGRDVYERYNGQFPVLIKFIDASEQLSVQVHPNDEVALERHGSMGKSEMWYVINSEKQSKIYSGFARDISRTEFDGLIERNEFMTAMASHEVSPGDMFFIPPGTVHAIGAGILLAEIQQSSDITYRIYDYGRKDKNGNPRELHTELAKDTINFKAYDTRINIDDTNQQNAQEVIRSDNFTTYLLSVTNNLTLNVDSRSFMILVCIEGEIELTYPEGKSTLQSGHSVLLPASIEEIQLSGNFKALLTHS